jgi:hypothetical protein
MRGLWDNYAGLELFDLRRLAGSTLRLSRRSVTSLLLAGVGLCVPLVASSIDYDITFTGSSNPSDIAGVLNRFGGICLGVVADDCNPT